MEKRILRAAVQVFARKSYHGSSIAEIAEEAGLATGTIYLYFRRKEDLLLSLFENTLRPYLHHCEPLIQALPPGLPQLRKLVELQFQFFEQDRAQARVFQIHAREVNPTLKPSISRTLAHYHQIIDRVVEAGVSSGKFSPHIDQFLARQLVFSGLDSLVTHWVLADRPYPLSRHLEPWCAMLARALGAESAFAETSPSQEQDHVG
ncbi:MAG: TetR/AcrR family transcriptional regulator [Planctomycetota bacterium]|nr:MAG: TetR/AcrR family transcriptional regulator [Planctomycetota bacterium]